VKLPHATLVIVADGQRHLILENVGQAVTWDLVVHASSETTMQSTGELGAERPGRYPIADGRRTTVEQTDWKAIDKASFSKDLARQINEEIERSPQLNLVLMMDAKTLGHVRQHLSPASQKSVLQDVTGDYVHRPIEEIAKVLKVV
jgi:protein required for attachment to host cells